MAEHLRDLESSQFFLMVVKRLDLVQQLDQQVNLLRVVCAFEFKKQLVELSDDVVLVFFLWT